MISLNRLQIIGHVTEEPKYKELANWASVADVNLLVKTIIKNAAGEEKEISSYHNITFWRWLADVVKNYTKVWSQIYVSWRLETDSWEDQEWNKRYKTKVLAEDLILLSRKDEAKAPEWSWKITSWINKAEVLWNITWDLELRTTPSWVSVTSFWVASNRQWKTSDWETQEKVEFHNVVVWEKLAESLSSIAKKWSKLYICWRVQNRSWESPDGQKRYTTEIIAESVRVLWFVSEFSPRPSSNETAVKDESNSTGDSNAATSSPEVKPNPDTGQQVPDIDYSTEIKPEDLPF